MLLVLFGGALAGAVRSSLRPGVDGFGLGAWGAVLSDPDFLAAVRFSAQTAALATIASGLLALGAARLLRDRRATLRTLFALPVPVPHLIAAVLALLWLAPGGLADRALDTAGLELTGDRTGAGVVLVYVWKETPFLALLVLAAWDAGVRQREEAAAALGAGPLQRLRFVIWPAVRAPLIVGSLIVAAFVIGAFEVPLLVGPAHPPTLSTFALDATKSPELAGQAQASAALLLAAAASLALAALAARAARSPDG